MRIFLLICVQTLTVLAFMSTLIDSMDIDDNTINSTFCTQWAKNSYKISYSYEQRLDKNPSRFTVLVIGNTFWNLEINIIDETLKLLVDKPKLSDWFTNDYFTGFSVANYLTNETEDIINGMLWPNGTIEWGRFELPEDLTNTTKNIYPNSYLNFTTTTMDTVIREPRISVRPQIYHSMCFLNQIQKPGILVDNVNGFVFEGNYQCFKFNITFDNIIDVTQRVEKSLNGHRLSGLNADYEVVAFWGPVTQQKYITIFQMDRELRYCTTEYMGLKCLNDYKRLVCCGPNNCLLTTTPDDDKKTNSLSIIIALIVAIIIIMVIIAIVAVALLVICRRKTGSYSPSKAEAKQFPPQQPVVLSTTESPKKQRSQQSDIDNIRSIKSTQSMRTQK
ncbi:uncharacterized protein LOC128953981 isoform X2 [Oppia nitens]|uniref:uncharacterized protein LOC128953981 isoform X2 n=1 Tax=Oppia nitens TaxID=1686743 RepID=UPI0023DA4A5F|nr:uncharacterized protein LOC128953981 isoform X2 [Oppia nitens]